MKPPTAPALNDPVVIDGVKYRIRSFETGERTGWACWAYLRQHFAPHATAVTMAAALTWDPIAGVWRAPE
jgi:hypothetical protein